MIFCSFRLKKSSLQRYRVFWELNGIKVLNVKSKKRFRAGQDWFGHILGTGQGSEHCSPNISALPLFQEGGDTRTGVQNSEKGQRIIFFV